MLRPIPLVTAGLLLAWGAWLRLEQLPFHQNLWAIDWLAYYEGQARDLYHLNLPAYLLRWEGLHPPLSGVLHGGMAVLGLGLPVQWAATIAASLLGPLILGIGGARRLGAGALILTLFWTALSPLQANYGLNTTPYPWLLLFVSASTILTLRILEGKRGRTMLIGGLCSALAIQVHVLAFAVVFAQAILLAGSGPDLRPTRRGNANSWWIPVGLSSAVLCGQSLSMTRNSWTFHVAESSGGWLGEVTLALSSRFGDPTDKYLLIAVVAAGILGGFLRGPRLAIGLLVLEALGTLLALCLFFELRVADPRLVHYYAMPQMLLFGAGAWGLSAVASSVSVSSDGASSVSVTSKLSAPRIRGLILGLALLLSGPWLLSTFEWNQTRQRYAADQIEASSAAAVRALFEAAREGDVVAYLWDNQFLNDESDHLDPVAARWPTSRLGRPCFDIDMPPHHCNAHGGSYFFFSPSAQTGRDGERTIPFEEMEESFRRMINLSQPPGRATIIVAPGADAPQRPWPMERWLGELGAVASSPTPGGIVVFSLPSGVRVTPPAPLHQ